MLPFSKIIIIITYRNFFSLLSWLYKRKVENIWMALPLDKGRRQFWVSDPVISNRIGRSLINFYLDFFEDVLWLGMAIRVRVSGSCCVHLWEFLAIWVNPNPTYLLNGSGFLNPNTIHSLNGLVLSTCLLYFIIKKKKLILVLTKLIWILKN